MHLQASGFALHRRILAAIPLCAFFVGGLTEGCRAASEDPCFAYLKGGDVAVVCGARQPALIGRSDISAFAVDSQHGALGFVARGSASGRSMGQSSAWVVDLKAGTQTAVGQLDWLVATCGGLLSRFDARRERTGALDLVTGARLPIALYSWFRCSADQKIVVGSVDTDVRKNPLSGGLPPSLVIAAAGSYGAHLFDVSPAGGRVAYFGDSKPLCVYTFGGRTECLKQETELSPLDSPSVNDRGQVLVSVLTDQDCYYRSTWDFSPSRDRTYKSVDQCVAVGYWEPGQSKVTILEPIGRAAQWISPSLADQLRSWFERRQQ